MPTGGIRLTVVEIKFAVMSKASIPSLANQFVTIYDAAEKDQLSSEDRSRDVAARFYPGSFLRPARARGCLNGRRFLDELYRVCSTGRLVMS